MRSAIKAKRLSEVQAADRSMGSMRAYPASVTPNSSAVLAITVLANLDDVPAVLRTAALLAKNFKTQLCVTPYEEETLVIDPVDYLYEASLSKLVDSIQAQVRKLQFVDPPTLVLEAEAVAASFVSLGRISVRIRVGASDPSGSNDVSDR